MMKNLGIAVILIGTLLVIAFGGGAAPSIPATAPTSQLRKDLILDLGDKVTMKLVQIPAGKFLMGSPETEKVATRMRHSMR